MNDSEVRTKGSQTASRKLSFENAADMIIFLGGRGPGAVGVGVGVGGLGEVQQ